MFDVVLFPKADTKSWISNNKRRGLASEAKTPIQILCHAEFFTTLEKRLHAKEKVFIPTPEPFTSKACSGYAQDNHLIGIAYFS